MRDPYPDSDPDWTAAVVDRVKQMVHRDKNHPSVVIWSLGNEAGKGSNFVAMHDWIRSYDSTRVIHYQGDNRPEVSDIRSAMHESPYRVKRPANNTSDTRPYVMIEYAHSMGNSTGNLEEYWDVVRAHDVLQGRVELGLRRPGPHLADPSPQTAHRDRSARAHRRPRPRRGVRPQTGSRRCGRLRQDDALSLTGSLTLEAWVTPTSEGGRQPIIAKGDHQYPLEQTDDRLEFLIYAGLPATRKLGGKAVEVKHVYQVINVSAGADVTSGVVTLTNEFLFTNLGEYAGHWELYADGRRVQQGRLTAKQLDVPPRSSRTITLPVRAPSSPVPGSE